jgi:hypothetical protein
VQTSKGVKNRKKSAPPILLRGLFVLISFSGTFFVSKKFAIAFACSALRSSQGACLSCVQKVT